MLAFAIMPVLNKRNRFLLFPVLLGFFWCCNRPEKEKYVIGFSQCISDVWRETMLEEMKRELTFHPGTRLIYKQAYNNTQQQIKDVQDLLLQDIDLLIISPNEAAALTPVVEEVYNKRKPVIVIDRKISSPAYSSYVGGDNYEVGKMAGEYAGSILKGTGKVLEITVLPQSSPAVERHRGFLDALNKYPDVLFVKEINGELLKQDSDTTVADFLRKNADIDLIFAQNDFLAKRVNNQYEKPGVAAKPKIIGVDGLPGKEEGLEMVANKQITATMLYPTGGEEAIQIAHKILNKLPFARENNLQTTVIDSNNVRYTQLQSQKMKSQQQSIERHQTMLSNLKAIYKSQQIVLFTIIVLCIVALTFGVLTLYALRRNREINRVLQLQNAEILKQKDEILKQKDEILKQKEKVEELSVKAQAANEAKVTFFTNISHEFRTPLTLIMGPLEELQTSNKNQPQQAQNLNLIQKNVSRLLRLINQLMDFRKIEVDKMRLHASENDIVPFIAELVNSFKGMASKRSIDVRFITDEKHLNMWFDENMMDKVVFNLLSNAFKFTRDGGFVYLHLHKSEDTKEVVIRVEDNGMGMTEEEAYNAFELFYQGKHDNDMGSGLGLSLSKELIKLHSGTISVKSRKWEGTTFEVRLPLGSSHLTNTEIADTTATGTKSFLPGLSIDFEQGQLPLQEQKPASIEKEYNLLLIEDNAELRNFIKTKLEHSYNISEAADSQSALQQAFDNVPDIIISDVVIPGKDGLSLVNVLKNDVRTSHIPIVLLTGKTSIEHQIEGMKNKADAYITKPFNSAFLEQTIQSLLSNRAILKEHFSAELPAYLRSQSISKVDKKFINDFSAAVESNLSDPDLSVDDLCKLLHVSRVQLYRKVKALFNLNVNEYILNARFQKAKYLLHHEESSIADISSKVGFSSAAYFSTVFKSKFGITPTAFKENGLEQNK